MHILSDTKELSSIVFLYKKESKSIGFVPTMGALHEGHLALIKTSITENDHTIVSIFVNPLQFNTLKDLSEYPCTKEEDIKLLDENGVDIVFIPEEKKIYPSKQIVTIDFGNLSKKLEGKYRPNHFEGVGVVVCKMLHLILPSKVYFGLKDIQQFILIKKMCEDLSFPCEVIGVDTVREQTGLALSSRNRLLSPQGIMNAQVIYKGLSKLKSGIESGEPLETLLSQLKNLYKNAKGFELEYLESVDPTDLSPVDNYYGLNELVICVAGYIEGVRLIDNLYLQFK